jgi:hypothetical protein
MSRPTSDQPIEAQRVTNALLRLGAVLAVGLSIPREADAYLDPGTGSFILQALVGSAMAAAFTIKIYWRRLKSLFLGRSDDAESESISDDADQ